MGCQVSISKVGHASNKRAVQLNNLRNEHNESNVLHPFDDAHQNVPSNLIPIPNSVPSY